MKGIFYHKNNKIISLLRFYQDNIVIQATYNSRSSLSDSDIKYFDREDSFKIFRPANLLETDYFTEGDKIEFMFMDNGFGIQYNTKIINDKEIIAEVFNHSTGEVNKMRFSEIGRFPERNDSIQDIQEFYPIILLPNSIINSIQNEVSIETVNEFLNVKIPKLSKLKLPTEPKPYKSIAKEKSKFKGNGCTTIATFPMVLFFTVMFFYSISSGNPILGIVFLVFAVIMGKELGKFTTIKTTEKEYLPNEIFKTLTTEYLKEKKDIVEKNLILEKEYHEKITRIEKEISPRINDIKEQIYFNCLKTKSYASQSDKEIKRGKTELMFLAKLLNKFSSQIKVDIAPTQDNQFYFPDFVFECKKTGLHVDIEIDEPYTLIEKKPIHHTGTNDIDRNKYFLEKNWCVIRFSEKQIIQETDNCVSLIEEIISSIHSKNMDFQNDYVTLEKRWTYEEALVMSNNNIRNKY